MRLIKKFQLKKFSKEILLILNPLLTEYVDIKNINLVIEKIFWSKIVRYNK